MTPDEFADLLHEILVIAHSSAVKHHQDRAAFMCAKLLESLDDPEQFTAITDALPWIEGD